MLGKLDGAGKALNAGKNTDAVQKLSDFLNKVTTLQAQGKIDETDAVQLISGAQTTIDCITGLSSDA